MDYLSPHSYWLETADHPAIAPPLTADIETEILVLGAGLTGLTVADMLLQHGRRVVVLEAGRIGAGTSSGTSGHLDAHPEIGAKSLIDACGLDAARRVIGGRVHATDIIEQRCQTFGADCDFRRVDGYYYTEQPKHASRLREELSRCSDLGLDVSEATDVGLPFPTAYAMRVAGMARFQVVAYLRHLAAAVRQAGGVIYEQTTAQPPTGGTPCTVETAGGTVRARAVVVATHSPYLGLSQFDARVAAYQSYVIAVRPEQPVPDALYWDDDSPYHYTRIASSDDPNLLIVGGADHKTGQPHGSGSDERDAFGTLEDYAMTHFGKLSVERRWSAEYFHSSDGLPFIGAVPLMQNVYMATGFGGEGLTYGPLAARVLADLLIGRENPLADIFSPARINALAAAKDLVTENLNVAKEMVTGFFAGQKVESLEGIPFGGGQVVTFKGQKVAVYRDPGGVLHALSPVCTHAGCTVEWNDAEKTWDCPCHGGRYTATGERAYGPPASDLLPSDFTEP